MVYTLGLDLLDLGRHECDARDGDGDSVEILLKTRCPYGLLTPRCQYDVFQAHSATPRISNLSHGWSGSSCGDGGNGSPRAAAGGYEVLPALAMSFGTDLVVVGIDNASRG